MEANPERPAGFLGARSVTYIVQQERALPLSRRRRARHHSSQPSIVVLAGLIVVISAVVNIVLQLVVWVVLT